VALPPVERIPAPSRGRRGFMGLVRLDPPGGIADDGPPWSPAANERSKAVLCCSSRKRLGVIPGLGAGKNFIFIVAGRGHRGGGWGGLPLWACSILR